VGGGVVFETNPGEKRGMMCVKFPYLLVLIAVFGELPEIISVGEFRRYTGILKTKIVNSWILLYLILSSLIYFQFSLNAD
jgi:hypothetical protein